MRFERLRSITISTGLIVTFAGLGAGSTAAASTTPDCAETTPDDNIAIVESYVEAHNNGDHAAIDATLHDEYVDNNNRGVPGEDTSSNADEVAGIQQLEALYPDHETRIDEIHAFDSQVVVASTLVVFKHTLTGAELALDVPVEVESLSLFTIECGLITTAWTVADVAGLLTELGFQIVPPAAEGTDVSAPTTTS